MEYRQIQRRVFVELSAGAEVHQRDAAVSDRHHLCALISMEQARTGTADTVATQLKTYRNSLHGLSIVPCSRICSRVRPFTSSIHSRFVVDALGAIDGDNIGVAYSRERRPSR